MLKTFVLLATVWHSPVESPKPFDVYVIDYQLTGDDCINGIIAGINSIIYAGETVDLSKATLSCELDEGFED